jgi:tripartite-type tricarboxylate transporter receptor subunit TctC
VFGQGQNQAKAEKEESVIHLKAIGRAFGSMSISCLLIFASAPRDAFAADERYPNRIIQLVLPQPAGGSVDSVARVLALHLSAQLGQPVVVDSRPGANGSIAAEYVARAEPDGHTLFMAVDTNLTINPSLYNNLKYDPYRDFAPISVIVNTPIALLANPSLKADNIAELIALAKAQPGVINYASVGHVPYKGSSTALPDLFRGAVSLLLLNEQAAATYAQSGQTKTLAVTSIRRSQRLPQVPTIAETIPGFQCKGWVGVLAPAKTPESTRAILLRAIQDVVAKPEFLEAMARQGLDTVGSSPEEMTALMKTDSAMWAKLIRDIGAKVE